MKTSLLVLTLVVVILQCEAQFEDSERAVSLGGAPVGLYSKSRSPYGVEESAASLGNAPVGLYSKSRVPTKRYYSLPMPRPYPYYPPYYKPEYAPPFYPDFAEDTLDVDPFRRRRRRRRFPCRGLACLINLIPIFDN